MELIDQIICPLENLPGVGLKTAVLLRGLFPKGLCLDICYHQPIRQIQWQNLVILPTGQPSFYALQDKLIRIPVIIVSHSAFLKARKTIQIKCQDGNGTYIDLIFFHLSPNQLKAMLPVHERRIIAGKIEWSLNTKRWQVIHPEILPAQCNVSELKSQELVYPLTAGITQKMLQKYINAALLRLPHLPEWLDPDCKMTRRWPSWHESLRSLHNFPPLLTSLTRLAYDELLAEQLALAQVRRQRHRHLGRSFKSTQQYQQPFLKHLPFELTKGQSAVIAEISHNLESPYQMMRLLQGDVGSGKTVVAMATILTVLENQAQCAILVPTEILARQHAATFTKYFAPLGITVELFIGKTSMKKGAILRQQLQEGHIQVAIGTHALLEDRIVFKNLGFVIIDEQHRFGVDQRQKICLKGKNPDVLLMTATPIPRSLQMTAYGDVDISFLREKPHHRQPLVTSILPLENLEAIIDKLQQPLNAHDQIYWVCPLVEESETLDLIAAETRFEQLQEKFGSDVAIIHGKMKTDEKTTIMERFKMGETKILVATTVIEVGVDVPNATIIVIEHAERFGLAQLHQLRGRVGRGHKQGHCLLLAPKALGEIARQRLKALKDTQDGFYIADMDLKLRGAGETLGKRQSGLPVYRIADLNRDSDLIVQAAQDAETYLQQDPLLEQPRGHALKILLKLFGYAKETFANRHLV